MTSNFMFSDIWRSLLGVCLYPLFVVIPGYALAWLCDFCQFRKRTQPFRLCLAICLSIAVCPVVVYLIQRFTSPAMVWVLFAAALVFALTKAGFRPVRPKAVVVFWTAIALFSLVDVSFGTRAYYPVTALDFSVRTAFTHSIAAFGIPPHNPFYFPGHYEPVRYHYFWLILCAMVERASFGLVSSRHAWFGGVVWCGIGLMALVALYMRLLFYRGPDTFRRRTFIAIVLLGATGLDILFAMLGWVMRAQGLERAVQASLDWWNLSAQICGFVSTALWEAHHLAGLIACMTAFLVLWEGARQPKWGTRIRHAVVAGVAIASALGISIYVTFVFSAFLAVWTVIAAIRKWWPDAATCVIAGCVALLCAAPYVLDLRGPAVPGAGPPLEFSIRPFSPVTAFLTSIGIAGGWRASLANLLFLPLNYFLEFGFFFAAGRIWWTRRKRPMDRAIHATATLLAVALLICTCVRSSVISNNDLGWRGILIAQFVLLLWAADIFSDAGALQLPIRRLLVALLILGFAGSAYDIAILRVYPMLADRGMVATLAWMSRDRQFGERNFAQREAYEWMTQNTASGTKIQFNPHVSLQETSAFLYAERQMVAGDRNCLAGFGGDPSFCAPIQSVLNRIYPPPGQPAPASIKDACRALPTDVLVAKDTDAVWRDPQSWVWTAHPLYENRFIRLFSCDPRFN